MRKKIFLHLNQTDTFLVISCKGPWRVAKINRRDYLLHHPDIFRGTRHWAR
ncbi:Protein of unknown function [Pyronema omphalodes CBS 100304]|uniref:Uncharacterized protein n=1 Tax=Pyronema omphalodes (strain CBS 100304) TaxID=1076935 RepID=U4LFS3_PYROM|nr:Protein of unknown function [Pyronema omphalodes CBS 100304]